MTISAITLDALPPAKPGPGTSARRLSISVQVDDASALWARAAAVLGQRHHLALEEIVETIGDVSDPDVDACLAAIFDPSNLAGCAIRAFEIEKGEGDQSPGLSVTPPFALHRAPAEPRIRRRGREADRANLSGIGL